MKALLSILIALSVYTALAAQTFPNIGDICTGVNRFTVDQDNLLGNGQAGSIPLAPVCVLTYNEDKWTADESTKIPDQVNAQYTPQTIVQRDSQYYTSYEEYKSEKTSNDDMKAGLKIKFFGLNYDQSGTEKEIKHKMKQERKKLVHTSIVFAYYEVQLILDKFTPDIEYLEALANFKNTTSFKKNFIETFGTDVPFILTMGGKLEVFYFFEENFLEVYNLTESDAKEGGGIELGKIFGFGGSSSSSSTEEMMSRFNRSIESEIIHSIGSEGRPTDEAEWFKGITTNPAPISVQLIPQATLVTLNREITNTTNQTVELMIESGIEFCIALETCVAPAPVDLPAWPHDSKRSNQGINSGPVDCGQRNSILVGTLDLQIVVTKEDVTYLASSNLPLVAINLTSSDGLWKFANAVVNQAPLLALSPVNELLYSSGVSLCYFGVNNATGTCNIAPELRELFITEDNTVYAQANSSIIAYQLRDGKLSQKWNFSLTVPTSRISVANRFVYFYDGTTINMIYSDGKLGELAKMPGNFNQIMRISPTGQTIFGVQTRTVEDGTSTALLAIDAIFGWVRWYINCADISCLVHAIGNGGIVFVRSGGYHLAAYKEFSGQPLWDITLPNVTTIDCVVGWDTTLYCLDTGAVRAYSSQNGAILWAHPLAWVPGGGSVAIGGDGLLLVHVYNSDATLSAVFVLDGSGGCSALAS